MVYDKNGNTPTSIYEKSGLSVTKAYDKDGTEVWESVSHAVSNNFTRDLLFDLVDIGGGTQGLACDSLSQEIAQLYTGKIYTIDMDTGAYTQRADSRNLGHGSAGAFEKTKRNPSDLYPALWVATGENQTINGTVYGRYIEVFIGETQSTINRAFFVELQSAAYSLFAFDLENSIVYCVTLSGYEPMGNGWCHIDAYDMTDISTFTDGSYPQPPANGNWLLANTPIDSFDIEFIQEVQSIAFFDGLICFLSDEGKVVFVDVETHEVYLMINHDLPPYEREGIGFIDNPLTGQTDMILSARQPTFNVYYKYSFLL